MGRSIDTGTDRLNRGAATSIQHARSRHATIWWPVNRRARPDDQDMIEVYPGIQPPPPPPVSVPAAPGDTTIRSVRLGALEIVPCSRTIRLAGASVDLGSRAFDLMMVLIEARGQIVSKEAIIARVWPTTTVVDGNLKVQLSILRRALGAERWRIKTVSGRGYLLVLDELPHGDCAAASSGDATGRRETLVIELDADPEVQAYMMRAVSDIARTLDGVSRLSVLSCAAADRLAQS